MHYFQIVNNFCIYVDSYRKIHICILRLLAHKHKLCNKKFEYVTVSFCNFLFSYLIHILPGLFWEVFWFASDLVHFTFLYFCTEDQPRPFCMIWTHKAPSSALNLNSWNFTFLLALLQTPKLSRGSSMFYTKQCYISSNIK